MLKYLIVIGLLSGQDASGTAVCPLIDNDAERLACYDSVYRQPPVSAAVPAPAKPTQDVAPAAEDFGLTEEQRQKRMQDAAPPIDMIESRVAGIERHPRDRYILTLENGQKWMQSEPTPFQRFHVGDAITIRKAALNSYLARGPGSEASFRVRRVD